jgi:competence protein ComEC
MATLGLIYISPRIGKYIKFLPEFYGIRDSFVMTMSAQTTTLPIILLNFSNLSLISPLANILVAPLIPIAMLFSALSLFISFINFHLAVFFSLPGWLSLEVIMQIINLSAKIPYASLQVHFVNSVVVFLYYCFLIWIVFLRTKNLRT